MIDLVAAETAAMKERSNGAVLVVSALAELATFNKPFEGSPRAVDLYSLHPLIAETFAASLGLCVNLSHWRSAIVELERVASNTTTHIQGERGFTGPLSSNAFSYLLLEYIKHPLFGQDALPKLADLSAQVEGKGEYYSVVAEQQLLLAQAYGESGDESRGKAAWQKAARALCGYGWRKDRTVWETFQCASDLIIANRELTLGVLTRAQRLSDNVLLHTDGRETDHAPNGWFHALARAEPAHAAAILARSMSADGGSWHWRWERALDDFLSEVKSVGDPSLVFLLEATLRWDEESRSSSRIIAILKRIAATNMSIFHQAIRISDAKIANDNPKADIRDRQLIKELALEHGVKLANGVLTKAHPDQPSIDEESFTTERRNLDELHRMPRFPATSSPLQILVSLRLERNEYGAHVKATELVNALGYRLIDLLVANDLDNVVRILTYLGSEWRYHGAGEALALLAFGFQRFEFFDAAAIAFTLAHRHLLTRDSLTLFNRAIQLNKELSVRALLEEFAHLFEGSPASMDVAPHLIRGAVQACEYDQAFRTQNYVTDVIEERLWGDCDCPEIFSRYTVGEMPDLTLDQAMAFLLIARMAHPENNRRQMALAGFCELCRLGHPAIERGIENALESDCLNTTAITLFDAIWRFESAPFNLSRYLRGHLQAFERSDSFVLSRRASALIGRAGTNPVADYDAISFGIVVPMTSKRRRAILSIESEGRIQRIDQVWPGATDVQINEFERLWQRNKSRNEQRMRNRWEAARERSDRGRPPVKCHLWETEIYELAFQRVITHLPIERFKQGAWDVTEENAVIELVSPRTDVYAARLLSRIPRPQHPLPNDQSDSVGSLENVNDESAYDGWVVVGRFERQVVFDDVSYGMAKESVTAMSGAAVIDSADEVARVRTPFTAGNWRTMWDGSSQRDRLHSSGDWHGPVIAFDSTDTYLGSYPVLSLSRHLVKLLGLKPLGPGFFCFCDSIGDVVVVLKYWWLAEVAGRSDHHDSDVFGCHLLARPDVISKIVKLAGHELVSVTRIDRDKLNVHAPNSA